ncbi:hypothetical protein D9M69_549490 [compost metagenome]
MDQVVEVRDFAVGVIQDRKVDHGVLGFVDVLDPPVVRIHRVHRQSDGLDAARCELILELGGEAQFSRAHRREVRWMGKQHAPTIAQPLMETDGAGAGVLFEIGGDIAKSETHGAAPCECLMGSTVPVFFIY